MNDDMITWSDDDFSSKSNAMERLSDNIDSYSGLNKSNASSAYRTFTDIEPNRSVRPGFNKLDYYAFRQTESVPTQQRRIIKMCMDAYDRVGIIRNIIDLMGDFGSQGINIVHPNKSVEKFYQQWFKSVNGKERSERFLNNLYKTGNVIMYRSYANVTPDLEKYMKSLAKDIRVEVPNMKQNQIPWRYNFFNPLTIELKDGKLALFMGISNYTLSAGTFLDTFESGSIPNDVLNSLPVDIKRALLNKEKRIPLDSDRLCVFHYKKDDWQMWANPMIYAILDDIIMLEKMRLADMSALDGAISNIRLWTLGNLEHKILPNKPAINKLRDILASNVGGGTMELVWGPELTFKESSSEVYKFLGSEKYTAVLNSIYAGLGVPPTLTGMATNGGGFTNNFISLKTLVERLQYGRDLLIKFWEKEIEMVRQAMGFRYKAYIQFDQMTLSDEAAEKALLLQLVDRDIISQETVLERFKEIPQIEKIRIQREFEDRQGEDTPDKASPFHNANHKMELEKIALQGGKVTPQDVGLKTSVPKDILMPKPPVPGGGLTNAPKPSNPNGRPPAKKDTGPRKQRTETPKNKPGVAEFVYWAEESWKEISDVLTNAYLNSKSKKNLRQLTKSEVQELEKLKVGVLTNVDIMSEVNASSIRDILAQNKKTPLAFASILKEENINPESMNIDQYRMRVISLYIQSQLEEMEE